MQPGGSARLAWDWRIILSAFQVTSLGGNRVRVLPASDLGLGWAAIRSILKNFSLGQSNKSRNHRRAANKNCIFTIKAISFLPAFFFPVCFSLLFLPFSRTLYDIMARSLGWSKFICVWLHSSSCHCSFYIICRPHYQLNEKPLLFLSVVESHFRLGRPRPPAN